MNIPGKKTWRSAYLPLAILLFCAGGFAFISLHGSEPNTEPTTAPTTTARPAGNREAALTVTVARLVPAELTRTITVNGAIHAWQEIVVSPEVGGFRVANVQVDVGDKVERGQELVRLSSTLLETEVASRQAMIKQRQAELINAEDALKRAQALSQRNIVSEADLDRLRSEALVAQARLESARADMETSMVRLQYTRITAPDAGIITARSVTIGQIAQAGTEMMRLLRQSRIEWRGEVPEARLAELHPGQKVSVQPAGGKLLTGTIRMVAPTISTNNRTGLVYVDIAAEGAARPGMFASGNIELNHSPALSVPLGSVVSADGYNYVFILGKDQIVERRKVETGMMQKSGIEIVSGVNADELVVTKGAGFLKDGDLVTVVESL